MPSIVDSIEFEPAPTGELDPRVEIFQDPEATTEERDWAFSSIVEQFEPEMYGVARKHIHNPHDVEEVVQESLTRALAYMDRVRGGSLGGWLCTIAYNESMSRLRSTLSKPSFPIEEVRELDVKLQEAPGTPKDPVAEKVIDNVAIAEIKDAVDNLPKGFRDVMVLFLYEDLSMKQIAEKLSIPIGTVLSRIHRSRAELKNRLGPISRFREVA